MLVGHEGHELTTWRRRVPLAAHRAVQRARDGAACLRHPPQPLASPLARRRFLPVEETLIYDILVGSRTTHAARRASCCAFCRDPRPSTTCVQKPCVRFLISCTQQLTHACTVLRAPDLLLHPNLDRPSRRFRRPLGQVRPCRRCRRHGRQRHLVRQLLLCIVVPY